MNKRRSLTDDPSRGFTLVEVLITCAILVIMGGAIFTLSNQSQRSYRSQQDLSQVVQQARIVMDRITGYIRQAGNDPEEIFATYPPGLGIPFGHETGPGSHSGIFPIEVSSAQYIQINSDITGSVGGGNIRDRTGDPDGTLLNLNERVEVRYDSATRELYIDNDGEGVSGEELFAENISSFGFTFYDLAGTQITDPEDNEGEIARVHIQLTAESEDPDPNSGKVQTITLQSDVMLRSKMYGLFK